MTNEEKLESFMDSNFPKMGGWCDPIKIRFIGDLIFGKRLLNIADIGVFDGKSTLAMAFCLNLLGEGTVYAIDPWSVQECLDGETNEKTIQWWSNEDLDSRYESFIRNLAGCGFARRVSVMRTTSSKASRQLDGIDLVHIDGNHSLWSSASDVVNWLPAVKVGGHVVFDDSDWESTKTAVELLKSKCELIHEQSLKDNSFMVFRKKTG